jgi:hypothetical protein
VFGLLPLLVAFHSIENELVPLLWPLDLLKSLLHCGLIANQGFLRRGICRGIQFLVIELHAPKEIEALVLHEVTVRILPFLFHLVHLRRNQVELIIKLLVLLVPVAPFYILTVITLAELLRVAAPSPLLLLGVESRLLLVVI